LAVPLLNSNDNNRTYPSGICQFINILLEYPNL